MGPYLALPLSFLAGLLIVSLFDKTDCFIEKPLTIILCFLSLAAVGLIIDYVRERRTKGKKEACPHPAYHVVPSVSSADPVTQDSIVALEKGG